MGVQTEKAMGNTCRKSEVKILEERQFNIDLGKEDPLTTSTHCYSIEETDFFSRSNYRGSCFIKINNGVNMCIQ